MPLLQEMAQGIEELTLGLSSVEQKTDYQARLSFLWISDFSFPEYRVDGRGS